MSVGVVFEGRPDIVNGVGAWHRLFVLKTDEDADRKHSLSLKGIGGVVKLKICCQASRPQDCSEQWDDGIFCKLINLFEEDVRLGRGDYLRHEIDFKQYVA